MTKSIQNFAKDWPNECEAQLWSREKQQKMYEVVRSIYWKDGLKQLFN